MEIIDIITIIYYILEILTLVYTIYVCIKHSTATTTVEEGVETTPESAQVSNSSTEADEENILMYIASSWLS